MGWYDENDPLNLDRARIVAEYENRERRTEITQELARKEIQFLQDKLKKAEAFIEDVADRRNWKGWNVWIGDDDIILGAKLELDRIREAPPREWTEEAMDKLEQTGLTFPERNKNEES